MSNRYVTVPDAAPSPVSARYSHCVEAGGFLYVTGQLPVDPDDPAAAPPEGVTAQTELAFENLRRIVSHAGYELSDTVFARIYLRDFDNDYVDFNKVYHRFFSDDDKMPGRTTVGVARLGKNALVEIDLVLYRSA